MMKTGMEDLVFNVQNLTLNIILKMGKEISCYGKFWYRQLFGTYMDINTQARIKYMKLYISTQLEM